MFTVNDLTSQPYWPMRFRLHTLLITLTVVVPSTLFAAWCALWAILVTRISLP
jgi:hypothetical protein